MGISSTSREHPVENEKDGDDERPKRKQKCSPQETLHDFFWASSAYASLAGFAPAAIILLASVQPWHLLVSSQLSLLVRSEDRP